MGNRIIICSRDFQNNPLHSPRSQHLRNSIRHHQWLNFLAVDLQCGALCIVHVSNGEGLIV